MHTATTDFTRRDSAIDILRALTMLLMIFVNNIWLISDIPGWLRHAKRTQDMLGLADVVFPCFIFVVGMSIPFAIERRFEKGFSGVSTVGHILTRSLALILMGVFIVNTEAGVAPETGLSKHVFIILMITGFLLVWNMYPHSEKPRTKLIYTLLKIAGILLLLYLAIIFRDIRTEGGLFQARWWGILGRIGWTYLICAFIYLFTRDRLKYLIPIWLGFIVLCFLNSVTREGVPLLDLPKENFLYQFLGILRMENGVLHALAIGGVILSLISTKYRLLDNYKKIAAVLVMVVLLFFVGLISHKYWIISKIFETPPFLFYCMAISVGAYAILYGLVEKGKAHWFNIIKVAGTATLTCYLVPYVVFSLLALIGVELKENLISGYVGILCNVAFAFMVIGITYLLGRVHIKLKI